MSTDRKVLLERIRLGQESLFELLRMARFDETPVPRASMSDLDEALWRRFAPEESTDQPDILLHKLGMADRDEMGRWRPTVAGVLMACRHPERFLPGAFIQAVAYRGSEIVANTSGLYQIDAKDLTGPLDQQIMDACAFVLKNMKVGAIKHPTGGREDIPQFDILSVFEALTNAVAHRDYSIPGAKVRLRLFHDRLEIYSPGMLPNTMTPDSMPFRQAARNEALTSLLARCPITDTALLSHRRRIMDKRGEGVPIILSRTEALSGQRPVYRIHDDSEVVLTLPAANEARPMP